jgi:hypothetical protein
MSGYNWSAGKSNNAVDAERMGMLTASAAAKALKVDTDAIREHLGSSEWHHSSRFYNKVDYYNVEEIEPEVVAKMKADTAARKGAKHPTVHEAQTVYWIEWTKVGSGRHARNIPDECCAYDVTVTVTGKTARVVSSIGYLLTKRLGTNGFSFRPSTTDEIAEARRRADATRAASAERAEWVEREKLRKAKEAKRAARETRIRNAIGSRTLRLTSTDGMTRAVSIPHVSFDGNLRLLYSGASVLKLAGGDIVTLHPADADGWDEFGFNQAGRDRVGFDSAGNNIAGEHFSTITIPSRMPCSKCRSNGRMARQYSQYCGPCLFGE